MLNGLGDAVEIERIRADIEATHGVRAFFKWRQHAETRADR